MTASPTVRVGIDATCLLDTHPTGVGRFTRSVLDRLARRSDLALSAFALTWRGRGRLPTVLPPGVTTRTRTAPARPLRFFWQRADQPPIEWWSGPVDVVYGPNFVVPPTRGAAAVVTVHDLTFLHFPELCSPSTLAYGQLIARAVRRGAWVHAVSPFVADEVRAAFAVEPTRVVAIDEGADPPETAPADRDQVRAETGVDLDGPPYVLSLGTIEPRKDLPLLVRAFDAVADQAPDLRLVVAGPDGWGVEAFDDACRRARARHRIVRVGWVSEPVRAALLRGAAAFAYPSVYEGFGLPPLEAMAAGTPVVATTAGALPYTVGDGGLLVPVGDADALADALARVVSDPASARSLVERGSRNVARFSWDRMADGLGQLLRDAAVSGRRSTEGPTHPSGVS